MQVEVSLAVALGALLFASWAALTAVVLVEPAFLPQALGRFFPEEWRRMVLGPFRLWSRWVVIAWWATALLSAIGWVWGFAIVWQDVDSTASDPGYPASASLQGSLQRLKLYVNLCTSQLVTLHLWTVSVVVVREYDKDRRAQRYASTSLLLAASTLYGITAGVFIALYPALEQDKAFVFLLLCVHAAHGTAWDLAVWGASYVGNRQRQVQITGEASMFAVPILKGGAA